MFNKNLLVLLSVNSLNKGFDGSASSIVFLILGIILLVGFIPLCYWTWWCNRNKVDINLANQKNWFSKFFYKNRLTFAFIVTILICLCGIAFILMSCGIMIPNADVE
ncbi:MAG: hypothetical protein LBL60_02555 [Mycoplasmataceae bacterium]|jgi:hypothetical protein|nr:hypothetical protein [Mycoplasmataceae bacterium]